MLRRKKKRKSLRYQQEVRIGGWAGGVDQKIVFSNFFSNILKKLRRFCRSSTPASPVAATGMAAAGEGARRGRKILLLLVLFTVCCYGGLRLTVFAVDRVHAYLATVKVLAVEHLEVRGNRIVSAQKIISVAKIVEHKTSMFFLRENEIKRRLEAIPWIKDARVKREWPTSVLIEVKEEKPLALLVKKKEEGQQLFYIDAHRRTFLATTPGSLLDFPAITGISLVEDEKARERVLAEALVFLRKVKNNNPYLPMRSLSEIHCTKEGELVVYMVEHPFPIFLGKGNIKQKYQRLIQVLKPLYKNHQGDRPIEKVSCIRMEYLKDKVLVTTAQQEEDK